MGAIPGVPGTSSVFRMTRSDVLVLRLSWLGLRFIAGIVGLMKEGDAGSDTSVAAVLLMNGGWMDKPFMFLGRRGEGDVMGRPKLEISVAPIVFNEESGARPPKDVAGKELRGIKLTGESGEDEGDGSDKGDESLVDSVVVGEDSADSDAWVEVLSWCLCIGSDGMVGRRCWTGLVKGFPAASISINLGSTRVTVSWAAMVSASRSKTDMKEGI